MFSVRTYLGNKVAVGAQIALDNHLFVNGWDLRPLLKKLTTKPITTEMVAVGFLDGEPITVAVAGKTMMAFCRPTHRKNGYASKTIKRLLKRRPVDYPALKADEGIWGSTEFWASNQIPVRRRRFV